MYGLLMDGRSIGRVLSGQVNEYWCTRYVTKRGKVALIDISTGMLRGFGNLDDVSEIPYSQYLQYYGSRRHRWESVPTGRGTDRAYRYVFSGTYPLAEPRRVEYIYGRDNLLVIFDESEVGPLRKQTSLFDRW